jgi:hypothetical protein
VKVSVPEADSRQKTNSIEIVLQSFLRYTISTGGIGEPYSHAGFRVKDLIKMLCAFLASVRLAFDAV